MCLSHLLFLFPSCSCYLCSLLQLCTCLRCVTSCLSLLLPPVRCLYVFFFSLSLSDTHDYKILVSTLTSYTTCVLNVEHFNSFEMRTHQCRIHTSRVTVGFYSCVWTCMQIFRFLKAIRLNCGQCSKSSVW